MRTCCVQKQSVNITLSVLLQWNNKKVLILYFYIRHLSYIHACDTAWVSHILLAINTESDAAPKMISVSTKQIVLRPLYIIFQFKFLISYYVIEIVLCNSSLPRTVISVKQSWQQPQGWSPLMVRGVTEKKVLLWKWVMKWMLIGCKTLLLLLIWISLLLFLFFQLLHFHTFHLKIRGEKQNNTGRCFLFLVHCF